MAPPSTRPGLAAALQGRIYSGWLLLQLSAQLLVLACLPASHAPVYRARTAEHLVAGAWKLLLWFSALAALLTLVVTRIVVVTAQSYGLTQYALQVVIRVLVVELIPLAAVLFVALRSTLASASELAALRRQGGLQALLARGLDPLAHEALPRMLAGLHASLTLAALSCVVGAVVAYLAVYGFTWAALPAYTHLFGQVFNPAVTLIFVMKTALFALAVAVLPVASALYDADDAQAAQAGLDILAPVFLVLLAVEVLCLVANYA